MNVVATVAGFRVCVCVCVFVFISLTFCLDTFEIRFKKKTRYAFN